MMITIDGNAVNNVVIVGDEYYGCSTIVSIFSMCDFLHVCSLLV